MQKMFSTIFFIRKILEEMCGHRVRNLKCVALTDHRKLFSNINQSPATIEDFRLQSDILELRQSIVQEKTVQEVRYIHPSQNIAEPLTKSTKASIMLLQLVQIGRYDLPGGTIIENSAEQLAKTWPELMPTEQQEGKSQEERDKTDLRAFFTPVRTKCSGSNLPGGMSTPPKTRFLVKYKDEVQLVKARDTSQSLHAATASASQPYDTQLVVQRGAEATLQVNQSHKQLLTRIFRMKHPTRNLPHHHQRQSKMEKEEH